MPLFKHRQRPLWIIAAPKVMTSTLRAQPSYYQFNPSLSNFLRLARISALNWRGHQTVLLMRDPVSRIKSFYRDAFRTHPEKMLTQRQNLQSNYWRRSQKIFFPHLGLLDDSEDTEIANTLRDTSFSRMSKILCEVWWKDSHTAPQSRQLFFRYKSVSLALKIGEILDTGCQESLEALRRHDIDPSIRKNPTAQSHEIDIDSWTLPLLKAIYSEDYARLGIQ